MTFKEKVHQHFLQIVADKVLLLQKVLADLKESASNETKSTAGDKHETALAMLQIEQANKRDQLKTIELQKVELEKINPKTTSQVIVQGSLIKTDQGYLYLSIASGKSTIEDNTVIALSAQSPLGSLLKGKVVGETIKMNQIVYKIEHVE